MNMKNKKKRLIILSLFFVVVIIACWYYLNQMNEKKMEGIPNNTLTQIMVTIDENSADTFMNKYQNKNDYIVDKIDNNKNIVYVMISIKNHKIDAENLLTEIKKENKVVEAHFSYKGE
jgi:uncharacterized protein YpmB